MVFAYIPVLIRGSRRYFPFVTIEIFNKSSVVKQEVFALVDSGSEHNIFHLDFAKKLGLSLAEGEPVIWGGYGSNELTGFLLRVDMRIQLGKKLSAWRGPVIFSEAARERQVLGQAGFFEFFNIEFRRGDREFEVRKR